MAWAARTLRDQGMPLEEIRAVLATPDPEIVRRSLSLHRERMEERLADQQRTLSSIERFLTEATLEPQTDR